MIPANPLDSSGKAVLVTGGGVGSKIAEGFTAAGARVKTCGIDLPVTSKGVIT